MGQIVYMIDTRNNMNSECDCIHVASSVEAAQQWIIKHGKGWFDDREYFFGVVPTVIDKDDIVDDGGDESLYFFDKHGNKFDEQPF